MDENQTIARNSLSMCIVCRSSFNNFFAIIQCLLLFLCFFPQADDLKFFLTPADFKGPCFCMRAKHGLSKSIEGTKNLN